MEAAVGRGVKSGKEYNYLFPAPTGKESTIRKNADVSQTVEFIQSIVPACTWQVWEFAAFIKGKTLNETCHRIWQFLYDHLPYNPDEKGIEQIKSPRFSWHFRHRKSRNGKPGVDCDDYSVFIGATLTVLGIPFKYRIAKYVKSDYSEPTWQHIYVVVPKDGKLNYSLDNRKDYITMDCVKERYDDEEVYLEIKDYEEKKLKSYEGNKMRLDYLDGLDGVARRSSSTIDVQQFSELEDDELGNIFKKAAGALKSGVQTVTKAVAPVVNKVVDAGKNVLHEVNRYANPATVLLRNGFLASMNLNLMKVSEKLRYAYLTDEQARKLNVDPDSLSKIRTIRDRAESIYWQAGGEKDNLKKAILQGKGNDDKKVPLSGLFGLGYIGDAEENRILGMGQLGEPVTAAAITAAAATVGAIAAALSQVKDVFKKDQPIPDSPRPMEVAQVMTSGSDTALMTFPGVESWSAPTSSFTPAPVQSYSAPSVPVPSYSPPPVSTAAQTDPGATTDKPGIFKQAGTWVKENPGKTGLIAAGIGTAAFFIIREVKKKKNKGKKKGGGLSGLPKSKKKPRRKGKAKIQKLRIY